MSKSCINKRITECSLPNTSAFIIQEWWKKYTTIKLLRNVHNILTKELTAPDLQDLINKCISIVTKCSGDGAGLTSGSIIDMLLCEFLQNKLSNYSEFHNGECDMKICDIPFSLKKINGKSTVALDWSKNPTDINRSHFTCNIIIINLKTEKWWKNSPKSLSSKIKITYNDTINSGIYIVDKQFCKYYVKLLSNNKTNTLIESQYLYIMIKRSILLKLFITLPPPNKKLVFSVLQAFL